MDQTIFVSLLAGRMSFDGKKVASDPRLGILEILVDASSVLKLLWRERDSSEAIDEINLTGDAVLERVTAAKTGRVYVLKQGGSDGRRFFFWGQEGSEEEENEKIVEINMFLQCPDVATARALKASRDLDAEEDDFYISEDDVVSPPTADPIGAWQATASQAGIGGLNGVSQDELMSIFQRMVESGEVDFDESDLENLEGLEVIDPEMDNNSLVNIGDLLSPEVLVELVEQDEQTKAELSALLPPGHSLQDTINSAQLKSAMRLLTDAVYSETIDLLFTSLQLDDSVATETRHPLKAFCLALERKYRSQQQ